MAASKGHLGESSVVTVFVNSPDGESLGKKRPAVVLKLNDDGDSCWVACVTTKIHGDPTWHVKIPYDDSGRRQAGTGLTKPCVVKADWVAEVLLEDCTKVGYVSARTFAKIKQAVRKFMDSNH